MAHVKDLQGGQVTVAAVGTQQNIGTTLISVKNYWVKTVTIQALASNTEDVFVGVSDADSASELGHPLGAKDSITFHDINLDSIWVDSSVNDEGVYVTFKKQ